MFRRIALLVALSIPLGATDDPVAQLKLMIKACEWRSNVSAFDGMVETIRGLQRAFRSFPKDQMFTSMDILKILDAIEHKAEKDRTAEINRAPH